MGAVGFYLFIWPSRATASSMVFINRLWGLPLYFFAQLLVATLVAAAPLAAGR
ncbi:MAG: hypothetical protein U5J78_04665 [Parasphingorhabdus sp.]|nr:hypothetical protein [Parasphingorhabdus sp.]